MKQYPNDDISQVFDDNGQPLAGGLIFTYVAGTTSPATTYRDVDGYDEHTNPIVLDEFGVPPGGRIFLSETRAYKLIIRTSRASLVGSYDDIVTSKTTSSGVLPPAQSSVIPPRVVFTNGQTSKDVAFTGVVTPAGSDPLFFLGNPDNTIINVGDPEIDQENAPGGVFTANLTITVTAENLVDAPKVVFDVLGLSFAGASPRIFSGPARAQPYVLYTWPQKRFRIRIRLLGPITGGVLVDVKGLAATLS